MPSYASIDVQFALPLPEQWQVRAVNALLAYGWLADSEYATFLPLGDVDRFDWQSGSLDPQHLRVLIEEKSTAQEIVGLTIVWQGTGTGGELLLLPSGLLSLSLSINRRRTQGEIDVAWYLERLNPAVELSGLAVQSTALDQGV